MVITFLNNKEQNLAKISDIDVCPRKGEYVSIEATGWTSVKVKHVVHQYKQFIEVDGPKAGKLQPANNITVILDI